MIESDKLLEATKLDTYPGYPTERLVMESLDDMTLPDGPWSTGVFELPSTNEQQRLRDKGCDLDSLGRPLHPWLADMISDPDVGVVTGLGEYWHWGPNRTADPIIINDDPIPKILLIQRRDTGAWALPGGFIDQNESATVAAKRELLEEAGIIVVGGTGKQIYEGPVADLRTTAHAWPETTAIMWRVEGSPPLRAGDDAADAMWFAINELPDELYGSHAVLISQAIDTFDAHPQHDHVIPLPEKITSYDYVDGGHMTYHRLSAATPSGQKLFIKSHDKNAFTDSTREAHSRQYLEKEKLMYDHINHQGGLFIPKNTKLLHGNTLTMDALLMDDGWHWTAPKNTPDMYIRDVLSSLEQLQTMSIPEDFHDTLFPTYVTHKHEGWSEINQDSLDTIIQNLYGWQPDMSPSFQVATDQLVKELPDLLLQAASINDPDSYVLSHHDFRQANLAWHPDHGTRIVDWSWAGIGRDNSDATTFLIDLHKSGCEVTDYLEYFNRDHALTMIGFWLAHSIWPVRDQTSSVRFHQTLSAVSAYDLLKSGERSQS